MHYALTTLPNGLRVITEAIPGLRSVAVGCWVDTGTRDELPNEAGASHFLEHLLFKGSETLTARQISETFDAMGAESNAFTTKEYTCFWARLLDEDLPRGLGVLAEMLQRPAFRPDEIDSERQVVIEEINMNDDDPSDVAFEEFTSALFDGHPLERPVFGTRESIRAMTRDDLHGYWQRRYRVDSAVLALTGSIDHDQVVELAGSALRLVGGPGVDHELSAPLVERRVQGGAASDRADPPGDRRRGADPLRREALRPRGDEPRPRRGSLLAALHHDPRGARAGVRDLQLPAPLRRHRRLGGLHRDDTGPGGHRHGADPGRAGADVGQRGHARTSWTGPRGTCGVVSPSRWRTPTAG